MTTEPRPTPVPSSAAAAVFRRALRDMIVLLTALAVLGVGVGALVAGRPGVWGALWAPVGLRYHALHHLLPSMPYHSLGECHRRLRAHLGLQSTYERANYAGLFPLLTRLVRSTMGTRAKG